MGIPTVSLRVLLGAVALMAVAIAVLLNPTPHVATVVINGIYLAVLCTACLAAGTAQPARSFWLGFVIACCGFLLIDKFSQRGLIRREIFTRMLVASINDWLPAIVHRGPPGETRYFRNDGRFPIYFYKFGENGERTGQGQMRLETARANGALKGLGSLRDLPHIDNVPTEYSRRVMLPYWLSGVFGFAGGMLSYSVRRRSLR